MGFSLILLFFLLLLVVAFLAATVACIPKVIVKTAPKDIQEKVLARPDYPKWRTALGFALAAFAREHGYGAYMPYLCNLDYVMLGAFGVPLYREHTCFEDGDYCDFKVRLGAPVLKAWPPVFMQGQGYK